MLQFVLNGLTTNGPRQCVGGFILRAHKDSPLSLKVADMMPSIP